MIDKLKCYYENRKFLFRYFTNRAFRLEYCHTTMIARSMIYYDDAEKKWKLESDIIGQLNNIFSGPHHSKFWWSEDTHGKCYLIVKVALPEDLMLLRLILGRGDIEYGTKTNGEKND